MRLLFAITVCAFLAVLWVALALARRIQRNQGLNFRRVARPVAREFFEAGEFRTPRALTLNQEIYQQRPRRALSEIASASELERDASAWIAPSRNDDTSGAPQPEILTPSPSRASFDKQTGRIIRICDAPTRNDADLISASAEAEPNQFAGHRILPSPDRVSGLRRRIDLSHYTKDMGDLTDPSYNHSRRGSGTEGPASVHRRDR